MAVKTIKRTKKETSPNKWYKKAFALLQRVGKSLLYPIAMLPFAAIALRLGEAIPQNTAFAGFVGSMLQAVGHGVFDNLSILFAVGIAFGMSKDQRGEAAIVGLVAMIILVIMIGDSASPADVFGGKDIVDKIYGGMTLHGGSGFHGLFEGKAYNQLLAYNVFTGMFAGGIVAFIYNKFNGIELPSILGFFSGRRLVPVLAMIAVLVLGLAYALIFPWVGAGLFYIGEGLGNARGSHWGNAGIMGAFGIINRLLIPFGLHHVINIPLWFSNVGGTQGTVVGDINIFNAAPALGNNSGTFQGGFFPVMMFGLPAIAAAIYFNAKGDRQKTMVASLFAGSALVSFFTGITEPIEFSFMFLAPALYGLHIILTGIVGFVVGAFGIQLGFGFSAGLIDYVLSIPKSLDIIHQNKTGFAAFMANPGWIWAIGAGTAAAYFFGANFLIKKFNLNKPGRGTNLLNEAIEEDDSIDVAVGTTARAQRYVKALGGYSNITMYSHCATRLRYDVKDMSKVNEKALQTAGAFGSKKISKTHIQIVVGPTVEIINNEIVAGMSETSKAKIVTGEVPT